VAQPARQGQPVPPYAARWAPQAQQIFLSYWTAEANWDTQIEIRNNVPWNSITVTPAVRTASGTEIALQPVTVAPEDVVSVDVRKALATAAPTLLDRPDSFGSVICRFSANSLDNIFGATIVQRIGSPIGFHFDERAFYGQSPGGTVESIWWLPRATASDYLILCNVGTQALTTAVVISDNAGHTVRQSVTVPPAATERLDLRAIAAAAEWSAPEGGVSVTLPSQNGLLVSQFVFDETTGMSAIMKTFDRDPADTPGMHTLRAPMMALAVPDPALMFPAGTTLVPQVFLRNAASAPVQATLNLVWQSPTQNGRVSLPSISLAPGGVNVSNLAQATSQANLPPDAYWGAVVLNWQGRSGDIVPITASFAETGCYGMQTPFFEGTAQLWKGGMWHVDPTHNTLITTGNGGTQPTHASLTLFYNGGQSSYTIEKLLQPDEQIWANVGDIIGKQLPDKDGKTIPANVTMGSFEMRDLDHPAAGYLFETKVVLDKTWGHGYYGCTICCGYHQTQLLPNPFDGIPGYNAPDSAQGEDCSNTWWDFTDIAYGWASTNSGVATVANAQTHLVSAGTATGSANVQLANTNIHLNCPLLLFTPLAPITVIQVTITSADITTNSINVSLQPANVTGQLSIAIQYDTGGTSQYYVLQNASRSGGASYTEKFNPPSIPKGEYQIIQADWVVPGAATSAAAQYNYHFKALGTYYNTSYNTPTESACSGNGLGATYSTGLAPTPCTNVNCTANNGTFKSDFLTQVNENGGGTSQSVNYISREWVCSTSYRTTGGPCPFCGGALTSGTSLAVSGNNQDRLACGNRVFVYNIGTGTVQDHGALAGNQLDHYLSTGACTKAIGTPVNQPAFLLY